MRSAELGALVVTTSALHSVFVVPSGETWICKEFAIFQADTTSRQHILFIKRGSGYWGVHAVTMGGTAAIYTWFDRWLVLEAGDELLFFPVSASAGSGIWVSGAKLLGTA